MPRSTYLEFCRQNMTKVFPSLALSTILQSMLTALAQAQTLTTLHAFANGLDGANPWGGLVVAGGTLYGTAYTGGTQASGIIFSVNTNGSNFTDIHDFTSGDDGANPYAGLTLSGNILYGTASTGGSTGNGTVFALNLDGSNFKTIHGFAGGSDGANPWGGVVLSGTTLYGTTKAGGAGSGTVFAVNTDGSGFKTLHSFTGSDGALPIGGLVLAGNVLYGTTQQGGASGNGTVFAVNVNGTGYTNLHSFSPTSGNNLVNDDGANPWAALFWAGNTLFGTAYSGGSYGFGTVFALNTDGSGFQTLHAFTAPAGPDSINRDGAFPIAGLLLSSATLYGAAQAGGSWGSGTIFSLSTNGTDFVALYNFSPISSLNSPNTDGAYPNAGLILSASTLFGTTYSGGDSGFGSVFSLSEPVAPPTLTITASQAGVILTWPTNADGFTLQSATNLAAPWNAVSPAPVIVSGLNTVTNSISGAQQFYRLSK